MCGWAEGISSNSTSGWRSTRARPFVKLASVAVQADAIVAPTLITVPFSHYCEKARWALDHAGVAYSEDRHLPLFHWFATFRAGGGRTVPVLVSDEGVLADSTDILRWADRRSVAADRLLPVDARMRGACDMLEDELDESFGPAVRRLGYSYAFASRRLLLALGERADPSVWEQRAFRLGLPLTRAFMMHALGVDETRVAASRELVLRTFDRMAELLRDGRPYLLGDAFSAADLTFAALGAPMVAPVEHPFTFPRNEFPETAHAMWREMSAHPAGALIVRLYAEHRYRRDRLVLGVPAV
jgi:glutathione S-transferase